MPDSQRLPALAFPPDRGKPIDRDTLQWVSEQAATPHKYGIVLRAPGAGLCDCPGVFRHAGRWYMTYVTQIDEGYDTWLAASDDLLHWETLGKTLARGGEGWDGAQRAGYPPLHDARWDGSWEAQAIDGRYWFSYLGGALDGYETPPMSIGMGWTENPADPKEWHRLVKPVLRPDQPDAREIERTILYKSYILHDPQRSLGHEYLMYYNAKGAYETVMMAVSDDLLNWRRLGPGPVIDNGSGISGDAQVVRMGDLWVMFYFGAFWRTGAFDTFAVSRDLVHWTKWDGPDLITPSEPWDETYAHKPWLIRHEGVVYHFYCAVGSEGRVIALATSEDLR